MKGNRHRYDGRRISRETALAGLGDLRNWAIDASRLAAVVAEKYPGTEEVGGTERLSAASSSQVQPPPDRLTRAPDGAEAAAGAREEAETRPGGRGHTNRNTAAEGNGPALTVLAIATEWDSRHGGLSTFNRDLCKAMSALGHRVYCLVPAASRSEQEDAARYDVHLLIADAEDWCSDEMRLGRCLGLPRGRAPDVVVGHGRVTGRPAMLQAEQYQCRRIHFIHVAPGAIEWHKDGATDATERAAEREQLEVSLARTASLVVAVGPLLLREYSVLLAGIRSDLHDFRPGLSPMVPVGDPPRGVQVLIVGRAEDERLKGLDIAVRAMALADPELTKTTILMVRGAPKGQGDDLRARLLRSAGKPGIDVRVRPFDPSSARVTHDIMQSSIVMMPSRSEGFGLVGLEAISAGVPVLLSDRSGLAETLFELAPEVAGHHVVQVTGDLEVDGPTWARRLNRVLAHREDAFSKARELRRRLDQRLSWHDATARMLGALARTEATPRSRVIDLPVAERRAISQQALPSTVDLSVVDLARVREWGWSDERLQSEIRDLDLQTMEGVSDEQVGWVTQWAPVFSEHPDSWRLIATKERRIVGYWHFVVLFEEQYCEARTGRLMDIDITADRIRAFELPGTYDAYFAGIAILPAFRRPQVLRLLLQSLLEVLQELAREEVYLREICANAVTPGGVSLCKTLNMTFCAAHVRHGQIFAKRLDELLETPLAKSYPELRSAYKYHHQRASAG